MSAACPHYLQERTSAPPNKSVALLIYVMSLMFENVVVFPITEFYVATAYPEVGGKASHVQTSYCAGAVCAHFGLHFAGSCPGAAGDQRRQAQLHDVAFDWPDHWIPAAADMSFRS